MVGGGQVWCVCMVCVGTGRSVQVRVKVRHQTGAVREG